MVLFRFLAMLEAEVLIARWRHNLYTAQTLGTRNFVGSRLQVFRFRPDGIYVAASQSS